MLIPRLLALVAVACAPVQAQSEFAEHRVTWDAERLLVDRLASADVGTLAISASCASQTTDPVELLYRFEILVRAGHDATAIEALDALARAVPPLGPDDAGDVVHALISRKERALALAAFERFPCADADQGHDFLANWAAEVGWETADRWAALRQPAAPDFWLAARLKVRSRAGKSQELFDEVVADARANPSDLERFLRLIRLGNAITPQPDLDWIATVFVPRIGFDAARLGEATAGRPPVAVILLERALAMPLVDEDVAAVREHTRRYSWATMPPDDADAWKSWLRLSIRHQLLDAYHRAGEAQKAQELMVAFADERPEIDGLPAISLAFAGAVQGASGAREIEGRVLAAEEEQHYSPAYWQKRAEYFTGRGEKEQALEAIDRALELTPFEEDGGSRYFLILARAPLLPRAQGAAFLRAELERMPADSEHARRLLIHLTQDWPQALTRDDPLIWRHLEATPEWTYSEERLLQIVAGRAKRDVERFWAHADELVRAGPITRAAMLGEVALRRKDWARVIALLETARANMPPGEARDRAALNSFHAYRELHDWASAEAMWPLARLCLTPEEGLRAQSELALAQAVAGAHDEAMRTWERVASVDRRELRDLRALADAGLRDRLVAFYADVARREPASAPFVARVLADLAPR